MKPIRRYKDAKDFLFKQLPMFQRIGPKAFKKDLNNIRHLLSKLNNPQQEFISIHIAGTNGKGSVSHFLAALLHAQGFKVGLYTSPHYNSYRERIKINGKKISKSGVLSFLNKLIKKGVFEDVKFRPSFFEITVAMAFEYFAYKKPDIVIVETGLGGRLDSTNVVNPILSIITNIGLDHTAFLGNTLELISREKAGIIKENTPVLIGRRQLETEAVFAEIAKEKHAELNYAHDLLDFDLSLKSLNHSEGILSIDGHDLNIQTPLFPAYQTENIQTALAGIVLLKKKFPSLAINKTTIEKAFNKSLDKIGFIGRFQVLSKRPLVIADSAHNLDGIKQVFSQLDEFDYDKLYVVYGTVSDKDVNVIMDNLPLKAQYLLARAKVPRAMDEHLLYQSFKNKNFKVRPYKSVKKALKAAKKQAGPKDIVLVTGSIFVVAEVLPSGLW